MNQIQNAFTLFLSLLVEAFPFLLLGVLLSSALLLFIDENKLIKHMPRNPILGAIVGSGIGFLFPVCECGNVPVARRLLLKGVPTSVAVGFLLAAPTINPIVVWSTWIAFRGQPEIVVFRVIISLAIAIFIGAIFSVQKDARDLLQPNLVKRLNVLSTYGKTKQTSSHSQIESTLLQSDNFWLTQASKPQKSNFKSWLQQAENSLHPFVNNVWQELRELGSMLIFGSAIAATIQVFVPRELILSLGQGTISSIIAMMLLAVIISICSTVDSFFALSFASTFTTSSLLAFLIFGPMIDLKSVGLLLSIFKPRMIAYILILAAQMTF
ncbi:MAG: permease, partial [Cyanobacteria bacterium J083]